MEEAHLEELTHLQRLYRITEGDRKAYCHDTKVTLLKQRKIIHKLEWEKREILSKMRTGNDFMGKNEEEDKIAVLLHTYHKLKRKMQASRQVIHDQKSEILNLEKEIAQLLLKCQNSNPKQQPDFVYKRIKSLEDKLENGYIHLNSLLHQNEKLREQIEHLMKERDTYKKICKQLNETLLQHKKEIEDLTAEATQLYNKRDEIYQKFQLLKTNQAHDRRVCQAQLQEARRFVQHQKHCMVFMAIKHRKRLGKVVKEDYDAAKFVQEKSNILSSFCLGKRQESQKSLTKKSSNFELFTYCSNLNNKMEELQKEIMQLKNELNTLNDMESESEHSNETNVKRLEEEIGAAVNEIDATEMQISTATRLLMKLRTGIESMLQLVEGDVALLANLDIRHSDEQISKPALMRALKEIENHVNELLQTRQYIELQEQQLKEQEALLPSLGAQPPTGSSAGTFQPLRMPPTVEVFTLPIPALLLEGDTEATYVSSSVDPVVCGCLMTEHYVKSGNSFEDSFIVKLPNRK